MVQDALVEAGLLEDDDYKHIPKHSVELMGYDKEDPRIEVEIIELKEWFTIRAFWRIRVQVITEEVALNLVQKLERLGIEAVNEANLLSLAPSKAEKWLA